MESTSSNPDMPPHDLEPPKFSRLALERILSDFNALKQILLFNHMNVAAMADLDPTPPPSLSSYFFAAFDEDSGYVDSQSGSIDLDKFVYFLIVKTPNELLVLLVDTLKKTLENNNNNTNSDDLVDAPLAVRRLVRSVARLFIILCMETFPSNLNLDLSNSSAGTNNNNNKKQSTNNNNKNTHFSSSSGRNTNGIYLKRHKININLHN